MPFRLPPLAALARRAVPNLLEGTVGPVVLFYVGYLAGGLIGGLVAAAVFSLGAVAVRLARGVPVSGLLVLSLVALAVRSATSLATGSVFVYFLQPTLGTFVTAAVFLGSVVARRPLTQRLSADLVDLPAAVTSHPAIVRLHLTLSLLWSGTFAASGALGLWLLTSQSVGTYLLVKTAAGGGLVAVTVVVSVVLFLRRIRRHGVGVHAA